MKPKKVNMWSEKERSPLPFSKCKNKRRREKKKKKEFSPKTGGQVFKSSPAWVFPLVASLFWCQIGGWDLLYLFYFICWIWNTAGTGKQNCSCSAWLFLGGPNPPWLRTAQTSQRQEFLCYQQRSNTKVNVSEGRLLYKGISHIHLDAHLYEHHIPKCNCNTTKDAWANTCFTTWDKRDMACEATCESNACWRTAGKHRGFHPTKIGRLESTKHSNS